ncbi:MAG: sulfide dehydrogenase [Rhodospirillales bacterium]|nr:sulfide dehydrogenase [Rhodospirillales bacterium]
MAPYLARNPAPSRWCAPVLAALAMCLSGPAAADDHAGDGARLAAPCAGCHGTAGRPPADSVIPGLAGRDAAELTSLLEAYRSGERASEEMGRIARGYSDAEIAALSAWFAARSPRSEP